MTGDGIIDILGGSYGGEITLYRGQEDGSYATREIIVQEGDNEHYAVTFTSAFVVDFNNDGLNDVIFGGYHGASYMLNIGTAENPRFSERRKLLTVDGTPVVTYEFNEDSNMERDYKTFVTLIDWDNDGVKDLITTNSYIHEGEVPVLFHKGTMTANGLVFREGVPIIKQGDGVEKVMPGSNYKVHFGDYNHDGKQDMLLGMTVSYNSMTNEFDVKDSYNYRLTRLSNQYREETGALYKQKLSREENKKKLDEINAKYKKLGFDRNSMAMGINPAIKSRGYILLFEGK